MAVRMIKIYLSLYTACGCITMSFACLSFFFPLPYANTESVRPAALSYTSPSVQQRSPGWNDWYDDGRDIGGFLSKAASIGLFTSLAKRPSLEAAGSSSWSLPGLSKGCDLFVPFAKAVGVFFFLSFLTNLSSPTVKSCERYTVGWWNKKKQYEYQLKLFWMWYPLQDVCSLWNEKALCCTRGHISYRQVSVGSQFNSGLAKEGPSPLISSH